MVFNPLSAEKPTVKDDFMPTCASRLFNFTHLLFRFHARTCFNVVHAQHLALIGLNHLKLKKQL